MTTIAILDIGKTNSKLSLLDASNGAVLDSVSRQSPSLNVAPYPHLDTDGLWEWYLAELKRVSGAFDIKHICVAAHGGSAALIDDSGLVLPVLDYEFAGPDEIADDYDAVCSPFTETYSPKLPHGLNAGRQLFWQRKRFPDQFNKARYLLGYAQYWGWLLTGNAVGEYTTIGAHTDLWNPVERKFSGLAEREGFSDLVPEMKHADEVLGKLSPEVSENTGIDPDCEVLVGIHDSNASLLPWLHTRKEPFTVISTGTWVITFAIGASLTGLVADRDCIANVNLFGDPVACTRYMGGREFSAVAGDTIESGAEADLERLMAEEIFVLPGFTREGGPFQNLPGKIDCSRSLDSVERTTLASLYCALVTDVCLDLCASTGDIIVEGAYAKNSMLMQLLDTLRTDQKVLASSDNTGTTLGAAMLATKTIAPPGLTTATQSSTSLRNRVLNYKAQWLERVQLHETANHYVEQSDHLPGDA